jgi:hypothetical protein
MLAEQTPEIDLFRKLFNAADRTPFLVRENSATIGGIVKVEDSASEWEVDMRLLMDRQLQISSLNKVELYLYTYSGQLLQRTQLMAGENTISIPVRRQLVVVQLRRGEQSISRLFWVN